MIDQQKYKPHSRLERVEPSFCSSRNNKSSGIPSIIAQEKAGLLEHVISIYTPPNNKTWGQK